ncbi:MAG: MBL fold metallo-hydrolase [Puniceicoccaceae bacterium]
MEITFLGTGTSQGVPMVAHDPGEHCDLDNPRNWRSRTSAHVRMGGLAFQIDAAPEFRMQCIQNRIEWIDHFMLTHEHADHILGMDDLRRFIDLRGGDALPVHSTPEGLQRVREVYPYAIRKRPEFRGYPAFDLREMPKVLETEGGTVEGTLLPHGRFEVLGLVFTEAGTGKRLAYYTDCKHLTPHASELAAGADIVVLDALRPMPHPTHMTLHEAVQTAEDLGAGQTYFTHMSYYLDDERDGAKLPDSMALAYDGLTVSI